MEPVDLRITEFIRRHHVVTVATVAGGEPYCANLFYAYIPDENLFVFTSGKDTRHGAEMAANSLVSASIVLETKAIGKIQGLQIQGMAVRADVNNLGIARKAYLRRFPFAAVAELSLWMMKPTFLKLTDNRLGFGKKIIWRAG